MGTSDGSIYLLPDLPAFVRTRAKQLGLRPATYLAILLHNYLHGPLLLLPPIHEPRKGLKRVTMQTSFAASLRSDGKRAAARWKLTFSELMESLIKADAEAEQDTLTIHPVRSASHRPKLAP